MDPDGREDRARPDGRRGDSGRVLAWAPGLAEPKKPATTGSEAGADAAPEPLPSRRPDTLGELDLVITPVSVTPPRTWRRAAWFAVGASCVVLTVLVFAAARLAGPDSAFDRIDAFPGLPTGGLLTAQPLGPPVHPGPMPTTRTDQDGTAAPDGQPTATEDGTPGDRGQPGDGRDGDGGHSTRDRTPAPTGEGPHGESVPVPTVSVKPSTGRPAVSADDLVAGTKKFYDLLPQNVEAAWGMVGPRVKVQGFNNFRKQWGDAAAVHLQRVDVDADNSSVLTTVRLVMTDGTEHAQRFRLVFRKGHSLIIDEIIPMAGDGQEPAR